MVPTLLVLKVRRVSLKRIIGYARRRKSASLASAIVAETSAAGLNKNIGMI